MTAEAAEYAEFTHANISLTLRPPRTRILPSERLHGNKQPGGGAAEERSDDAGPPPANARSIAYRDPKPVAELCELRGLILFFTIPGERCGVRPPIKFMFASERTAITEKRTSISAVRRKSA